MSPQKPENAGIPCPQCGHIENKVLDSRHRPHSIWRRRECTRCHLRYSTFERSVVDPQAEKAQKWDDLMTLLGLEQ